MVRRLPPMMPFGGQRTIINNNFAAMPLMHNCGCGGGNSWFNLMMLGNMFSSWFNPTPLASSFYPYTNFSEGAGSVATTPKLTPMQEARKTMDDLGFTKDAGYGVYQDETGRVMYTYTDANGKMISANSCKELLDKVGCLSSRQKVDDSGDLEESEDLDLQVVADDGVDEADDDVAPDTTKVRGKKPPKGWYPGKSDGVLGNLITVENIQKVNLTNFSATQTDAVKLAFKILDNKKGIITEANILKLASELTEYNVSVFDQKTGNFLSTPDLSKLDIPSTVYLKDNGYTSKAAASSNTPDKKAHYVIYVDSAWGSDNGKGFSGALMVLPNGAWKTWTGYENVKDADGLVVMAKQYARSNGFDNVDVIVHGSKRYHQYNGTSNATANMNKAAEYYVGMVYDKKSETANIMAPDGSRQFTARGGGRDVLKAKLLEAMRTAGWTNIKISDKKWDIVAHGMVSGGGANTNSSSVNMSYLSAVDK